MPALALIAALMLSPQFPGSTPDGTVQAFVQAIGNKDLLAASKLVKGGTAPDFLVNQVKRSNDWPKLTLSNMTDTPAGARTIVDFKLKTEADGATTEEDDYLVLTQVNGAWVIDGRRNQFMNEVMAMITNADMYVEAHKAAESTLCLSNVKQLALGTLMYTNDSDDVYKFTATNWATAIGPYVKNKDIFKCPSDSSGTVSYSLNSALLGKNSASFANPALTVMVYEGKGGQLNYRHNGRASVGFADGHAKLLSAAAAKTILWKP